MKKYFLRVVATGCLLLCAQVFAAAFTPGNLVVYRIGDGNAAPTNAATAVFLDEYTPSGTAVQSIAVQTSVSGANRALVASGTSPGEGLLSRSANGACIVLTGHNTSVGTASVSGTTAAATPRVIGVASANGRIDTSTSVANFSTGNIRTAASTDCNELWAAGASDGVRYVTKGAVSATATQISADSTSNR